MSNIKIYSGETPTEALENAKKELGSNVTVIKSNEIRKKSINQSGLYEVVVYVEEELPKNSIQKKLDAIEDRKLETKRAQKAFQSITYDKIDLAPDIDKMKDTIELKNLVNEIRHIADGNTKNEKSTTFTPTLKADLLSQQEIREMRESKKTSEELNKLQSELKYLKDEMKLLQNTVWLEKNPNLIVPPEFAEIYRTTKHSGILPRHLDPLFQLSIETMPLNMRNSTETIKRYFRTLLKKMILCRNENLSTNTKKMIMFIGPTGVGKTTTIGKLAARYSLSKINKTQQLKVGMITLDNYRIGAQEQLGWYARSMKLPFESVRCVSDFDSAIKSLQGCNYILIDTAGHSQNDKEQLNFIKSYMNNDFQIDVNLVLSATTKFEDLLDIYQAFNILNIDTLIFSKLDESNAFGNIFSLLYEVKKPVSYLSIGQEVPDDIVVASSDYIINCMLDGFKHPKKLI